MIADFYIHSVLVSENLEHSHGEVSDFCGHFRTFFTQYIAHTHIKSSSF